MNGSNRSTDNAKTTNEPDLVSAIEHDETDNSVAKNYLSSEMIQSIRLLSGSPSIFSKELMVRLYSNEELCNKNCNGKRGRSTGT